MYSRHPLFRTRKGPRNLFEIANVRNNRNNRNQEKKVKFDKIEMRMLKSTITAVLRTKIQFLQLYTKIVSNWHLGFFWSSKMV